MGTFSIRKDTVMVASLQNYLKIFSRELSVCVVRSAGISDTAHA